MPSSMVVISSHGALASTPLSLDLVPSLSTSPLSVPQLNWFGFSLFFKGLVLFTRSRVIWCDSWC